MTSFIFSYLAFSKAARASNSGQLPVLLHTPYEICSLTGAKVRENNCIQKKCKNSSGSTKFYNFVYFWFWSFDSRRGSTLVICRHLF